jgi:hypothetical protein
MFIKNVGVGRKRERKEHTFSLYRDDLVTKKKSDCQDVGHTS